MMMMSMAQAQQQQPIYQNQSGRKGGHESDCNFTPSPVIDPTVVAGRRPIYGPAVTHGHSGPYTYGMSRR